MLGPGDHVGEYPPRSFVGASVNLIRPEPSEFTTYSSFSPSLLLRNARREPSGDHTGMSSQPGSLVTLVSPVPSGRAVKMSGSFPAPVATNAIRLPSGDQDGLPPSASLVRPEPSALAR